MENKQVFQERENRILAVAKTFANLIALAAAALPAFFCWAEKKLIPGAEAAFHFWGQCMALIPGHIGIFLRRAYYKLTLESCSFNCLIGFGTLFSHRQAYVEPGVYIGAYSLIGAARLRRGCLVGSRVSVLSGASLHELDENGRWMPSDMSRLRQVEIGEYCWIGEGAIVMANIGPGAMVAAGAVCSSSIPASAMVAGNPARFVKKLTSSRDSAAEAKA